MLKVVTKMNKVADKNWEKGTVRMSEDGKLIVMIVEELNHTVSVLVLKNETYPEDNFSVHDAGVRWIEKCPIVVDDAKLIIGGNQYV